MFLNNLYNGFVVVYLKFIQFIYFSEFAVLLDNGLPYIHFFVKKR